MYTRDGRKEESFGEAARDSKGNSTYLAYFSTYMLPKHVETNWQGYLVTAGHSILAGQFVKNWVPDVIALKQITNTLLVAVMRRSRMSAVREQTIRSIAHLLIDWICFFAVCYDFATR